MFTNTSEMILLSLMALLIFPYCAISGIWLCQLYIIYGSHMVLLALLYGSVSFSDMALLALLYGSVNSTLLYGSASFLIWLCDQSSINSRSWFPPGHSDDFGWPCLSNSSKKNNTEKFFTKNTRGWSKYATCNNKLYTIMSITNNQYSKHKIKLHDIYTHEIW